MGDAAELVLDGYLDWNGEYTGKGSAYSNSSHKRHNRPPLATQEVKNYLGQFYTKEPEAQTLIIQSYGKHKAMQRLKVKHICKAIRLDKVSWEDFKTWVKGINEMKTKPDNDFPEIEWEVTTDLIDQDPDERLKVYSAVGRDKEGKYYSGSAHYYHDEFEEIKDIEEV